MRNRNVPGVSACPRRRCVASPGGNPDRGDGDHWPVWSSVECLPSPLQLVNIQAAREICRQCAGEMSSTFTNSFKHLMNVLKLREKMSCLGLGWLLGIQSCMNEELKFILS